MGKVNHEASLLRATSHMTVMKKRSHLYYQGLHCLDVPIPTRMPVFFHHITHMRCSLVRKYQRSTKERLTQNSLGSPAISTQNMHFHPTTFSFLFSYRCHQLRLVFFLILTTSYCITTQNRSSFLYLPSRHRCKITICHTHLYAKQKTYSTYPPRKASPKRTIQAIKRAR